MKMLRELAQWLGTLLVMAAAALVVCLVFLPGNPAWMVALGLTIAFLAAFGGVWLVRLVLGLMGRK